MNDIQNLVFMYTKSGLSTLQDMNVGKIEFSGKYDDTDLCIVYAVEDQKYMIRLSKIALPEEQPEDNVDEVKE